MGKAKKIESIVNTRSVHVLYSVEGKFYNILKDFPATLFDRSGYIIFTRESDYLSNGHLKRGVRLNVPEGISQIRGYQKYTENEKSRCRVYF